jgi:hypothetical protein
VTVGQTAFKRDWETPSRPLAYLEVGTSGRYYEEEIYTKNCNFLGRNGKPSSREDSNISEEHTATIFRVNKSSSILNSRNAAICTPHYTGSKTKMLNIHRFGRKRDVSVSFVRSVILLVT